jgi:hypothetical protein
VMVALDLPASASRSGLTLSPVAAEACGAKTAAAATSATAVASLTVRSP